MSRAAIVAARTGAVLADLGMLALVLAGVLAWTHVELPADPVPVAFGSPRGGPEAGAPVGGCRR